MMWKSLYMMIVKYQIKKKDLQNLTNINLTIKEGKKEGIDKAVINISTF